MPDADDMKTFELPPPPTMTTMTPSRAAPAIETAEQFSPPLPPPRQQGQRYRQVIRAFSLQRDGDGRNVEINNVASENNKKHQELRPRQRQSGQRRLLRV